MGAEASNSYAKRAFGTENRARLIAEYLDAAPPVTPDNAWRRLYELLLWIDRTTGLAHCYESDKCQPGRPWYARSMAFHEWLAIELDAGPGALAGQIDLLFRTASKDIAMHSREARRAAADEQRKPYEGQDFPLPGEDPELVRILIEVLGPCLQPVPDDDIWRVLTERIHAHVGQENKRKNLLGEGFEDALAAIIRRLPGHDLTVSNRVLLGDIPGFQPQGPAEKQKRVDLTMWDGSGSHRHLVTAKWSVRADREEQFGTDFEAYVRSNAGPPFDYVLVTNEFDAARLKAACDRVVANAHLFTKVVHINPAGILAAYAGARRGAAQDLERLIRAERLVSLRDWLGTLA